ncbi:uncharacterized protein BX663DRAFT_444225 [Cokeromyces recurvatus]|uniref:uncharacterized protein n=1 Tax=Cokeromyces recurvatus TaxID=90255 RepID=UPI00221FC931|nr:uncharacterized protein BX663DRAFT_444225 [Cokeromyces recurvatus]KAI7897859.1 hypothetical protein BX663DRAFT_444225 [Cokeromyces recurvatus]
MQTRSNGKQVVKAALTPVASDLPAQRKCLGLAAHSAAFACHKCNYAFKELPSNPFKQDFTNFDDDEWALRSNSTHRANAYKWKSASTSTEAKKLVKANGTRWSSLLRLSYFDPIRFAPIDVMHNCYLGVAKRMMLSAWRGEGGPVSSNEEPRITKQELNEMASSMEGLTLPYGYDIGALKREITAGDGFSNMKADEWRVFILALSPFLLSMRLNARLLVHWMLFVEANKYLGSACISLEEVDTMHTLLKQFLQEFKYVYQDQGLLTINSHNLLHIKNGILDYGPAMSHWLFNFERYNSDLKAFNVNKNKIKSEMFY